MSKSYDNCIYLSDSPEEVTAKVKQMFTDPARARRSDPGTPDICPVYGWLKMFSHRDCPYIHAQCPRAGIGCVDCKKKLADKLVEELAPIYEKRCAWENRRAEVEEILRQGDAKARSVAQITLAEVRAAMGLVI
jgi:tryptophanyl-tRNA synthetase